MTGLTIDKWGPGAWNTLHTFAHRAPLRLGDSDAREWKHFLTLFADRLPCPTCRKHFGAYIAEHVTDTTFNTRQEIVIFLNNAHNDVNVRLGKRTWTLDEHNRVYSTPSQKNCEWDTTLFVIGSVLTLSIWIIWHGRRHCKHAV